MATHPETELIPYLRGELSADDRARVASHLDGCDQCRREAESSSQVLRELEQAIAGIREPDWYRYRIELRRKLAAERPVPWWQWRPAWVWASVATMGISSVALLLIFTLRQPTESPSVDQLAVVEATNGGADVDLLRNYKVVEDLDLYADYDVIEHLNEIAPEGAANGGSRS